MSAGPQVKILCTSQDNTQEVESHWLDVCEVDEMQEAIDEMFAEIDGDDDDKAWEVLEAEGFYGLASYVLDLIDLDKIEEIATAIAEYGEAYAAYADNVGTDSADERGFQEAYCGKWDSEEAYAEYIFNELYMSNMPKSVQTYINYAAFARDLFCGDYYTIESEYGLEFVFRNC